MQMSDLVGVIDTLDDTKNLVNAVGVLADSLNDLERDALNTTAGVINKKIGVVCLGSSTRV